MGSSAEDVTDSRSNATGRKRALHTSDEDREVITIDSSSDDDDESASQPRKRIKQDTSTRDTEVLKYGESSSLQGQSIDGTSKNHSIQGQANVGQPGVWNKGVQSGLRTSFRSKTTTPSFTPVNKGQEETQDVGGNAIPGLQDVDQAVEADPDARNAQPNSESSEEQVLLPPASASKSPKENGVKGSKKQRKLNKAFDMVSRTETLAAHIARHGWPITKEHPVTNSISAKETFYPFAVKNQAQYTFGSNIIDLPELVDLQGSPIKLQDFSFRDFVLFLVAATPSLKGDLADKRAKAAYRQYLSNFYFHVPNYFSYHDESTFPLVKDILQSHDSESLSLIRAVDYYKNKLSKNSSPLDNNGKPELESESEGEVASDDPDFDLEAAQAADRVALSKYFPTTDDSFAQKCLVCGSGGHESFRCPDSKCSTCGSKGNHLTSACPQAMVCGKCRGKGHRTLQCPEKLRATQNLNCIICQSPSHIEEKCHFVWRSFLPEADEIQFVQELPIYCYCCGSSGHFGPDCGLHRGTPLSGGHSWSRHNLEKYLDPSSESRAMSAGKDYSIPSRAKKGFSIKGKGRANDPIDLDDSDEDASEFIRPKINNVPKNGQIQFQGSAFASHATQNSNSRGGGGGRGKGKKRSGSNTPTRGGNSSRGSHRGKPKGSGGPPPRRGGRR